MVEHGLSCIHLSWTIFAPYCAKYHSKYNQNMKRNSGSPAKVCGLCIDSCKSKQEEFSINDAPKLCSELLDLCIEGFCSSIG